MLVAGRSKNSSHREVLNVGPAMWYLLRCRHKHSISFAEHMESILLCSNSFFHPNAVVNRPGLYIVAIHDEYIYIYIRIFNYIYDYLHIFIYYISMYDNDISYNICML